LELDEELCIYFIVWQKVFDRVNWTKLMQIQKISGIDWCERRLFRKLYVEQKVKCETTEGRQDVCRFEEQLDKDAAYKELCSLLL